MRMKSLGLLAITAGLALVANAIGEDKDNDHKSLVGTWTLTSLERGGKAISSDEFKDTKLTIGAHKDGVHPFVVKHGDKEVARGTISHDLTSKPKTFDTKYAEGPRKGKVVRGIYELDGDTLKVCWARHSEKRPTKFATASKSGYTLRVYKRDK